MVLKLEHAPDRKSFLTNGNGWHSTEKYCKILFDNKIVNDVIYKFKFYLRKSGIFGSCNKIEKGKLGKITGKSEKQRNNNGQMINGNRKALNIKEIEGRKCRIAW